MKLTCGIVVYDEIREIQKLIPNLVRELETLSVEWIFVFNHQQAEIRNEIKTWLKAFLQNTELIFIENPANHIGQARQLILTHAKNESVYMTDPDIEIVPGAVKGLIKHSVLDSSFIAYGGPSTYRSQNIFLSKTFDLLKRCSGFFPWAFQTQNHSATKVVDHLPTCHLLINKTKALQLGGFSNDFAKVGEDTDFSHRAFCAGQNFLFVAKSQVYHWQNLPFLTWLKKIFNYGRVQITVQRKNFQVGIRGYRLMPLFFSFVFLTCCLFLKYFLFGFITFLIGLGLLFPVALGFIMTVLAYTAGAGFELFYQIFELKNAEQSLGLKSNSIYLNSENK